MMIQTPAQALANRTARLVAEGAHKDRLVFTSTSEGEVARKAAYFEPRMCTGDYCFVCRRSTDHFGEHSDEQIVAAAERFGQR